MRTIALALCVAFPVYAADVPRAELVRDDAGVPTHVLTPIDVATRNEAACAAAEAERDSLKASVKAAPSPVAPVVVGVAGVVLAVVAAVVSHVVTRDSLAVPK